MLPDVRQPRLSAIHGDKSDILGPVHGWINAGSPGGVMKDRSMKAILAMYDRALPWFSVKHQLVGTDALRANRTEARSPQTTDFNRRGSIYRSGFVPSGEDDKRSFLDLQLRLEPLPEVTAPCPVLQPQLVRGARTTRAA